MEQTTNKRVVGEFYLPLHNAYSREPSTYSLKGFFISNSEVVRGMDKRLEPNMKSDIVNIKMSKDGTANRTIGHKELSENEMQHLKYYAKNVSQKAVDEIRSGYIAPTPSAVSSPCNYCPYVHICLKNSSGISYRRAGKVNLESFGGGEK